MPNYGDPEYWNSRYQEDKDSPFDWLFDYDELHDILEFLIPEKDSKILLVGSGNAPFSRDLFFKGKFTNLINIDLSSVVVQQQKEKYPEQEWHEMDVLNMSYENSSFPVVIDKSLIDTLLCYQNSIQKTQEMITEIHRVLAPGSMYITFSLHSIEEIYSKFLFPDYDWKVYTYRVKSNRWNDKENRMRSVAHSMVVCIKNFPDNSKESSTLPASFPGVLSEEEYIQLKTHADSINLKIALQTSKNSYQRYFLLNALDQIDESSLKMVNTEVNYFDAIALEIEFLSVKNLSLQYILDLVNDDPKKTLKPNDLNDVNENCCEISAAQ